MKSEIALILGFSLTLIPAHAEVVTFRRRPPNPADRVRCDALSVFVGATQFEGSGPGFEEYDESGGVALDCSWSWSSDRTALLTQYSGSYAGNRNNQSWNGGTNELEVSALRHLSPRTTWLNRINLGQIDASDTFYQRIAALKTNYDGLINAAGASVGTQGANDLLELASSSPIATNQFSLWSLRQRYVMAESTFLYQKSERTSWYTKLFYNYTAYGNAPDLDPIFTRNYAESGIGVGVDRHLNERTIVGLDVQAAREQIRSEWYLNTTGQVRISRMLTPRWTVSGAAGAGSRYAATPSPVNTLDEAVGSGSLSYRGASNALVWSVSRGMGMGPTAAYSAELVTGLVWIWERPAAKYSITTMAQYNRSAASDASPVELKLVGLAIGQKLSRTTSIFLHSAWTSGQGVYLPLKQNGLPSFDAPASRGRAVIRVGIVFTPRPGY